MNRYSVLVLVLLLAAGSILAFGNLDGITGNAIADFDIEQEEVLVVPVRVHLVSDDSGLYTSLRDEDNVGYLFKEANKIWEQGRIEFEIVEINRVDLSTNGIPGAINGDYSELTGVESYDNEVIDLFLARSLNGLNGLALPPVSSALVADKTTVNDYRTTAHEFGHLFGLKHVQGNENLMAMGRNGEILSDWEIVTARRNAEIWLS